MQDLVIVSTPVTQYTDGGWIYTSLHDFTGQSGDDGAFPAGGVIFGPDGKLYGTAPEGGTNNAGTVFEITK